MFLKSFTLITPNGDIIREVLFKKGVNLILNSPTDLGSTRSGNSVGKTTFLRCIDYCLGGKEDGLYIDQEFKRENEEVKHFLVNQGVIFQLSLSKHFEDSHGEVLIERQLRKKPKIDRMEYSEKDFKEKIGSILFKLKSEKPSLRQIIKKFIRIESPEIDNTLKFLHSSQPKNVYELVFLQLFGFESPDLLEKKDKLNKKLKKLNNQRKAFDVKNPNVLQQSLLIIERDIKDQEEKVSQFEVTDVVNQELVTLEKKRKRIAEISVKNSNLKMRLGLMKQTLSKLESSKTDIDSELIQTIYQQAKVFVKPLQKDFEDVLGFHNRMIENKINFVKETIGNLEKDLKAPEMELQKYLKEEQKLLQSISSEGALDDLEKLHGELRLLHEERGKKQALIEKVAELDKEIQKEEKNLDWINHTFRQFEETLKKREKEFNFIFSDFTRQLYNEEYIFTHEIKNEGYEFTLGKVRVNTGTGKKKTEITAFDLAYIKFLEMTNSTLCRFVIHDRNEVVDSNQVNILFDLANELDGQYVVAILHDKLEVLPPHLIEQNKILVLSQEDKFFRLTK